MRDGSQGNARLHTLAREHAPVCRSENHNSIYQRKYRRSSTSKRRGRSFAGVLFPLPPLRLRLPEDAYSQAPACWWSRERFVCHAMALYDQHYTLLRDNRMVDAVSRETFLRYLHAESAGADYRTGREARKTVATLQVQVGMSESTIHRCRRLLHKLGCRTVVFRGRHRTLEERLDSWKRDDRARGWSAVAALHETDCLPVDNQLVQTLLEQGIGTPPPRSGGSFPLTPSGINSSLENVTKRRAPRGPDKRRRRRTAPAYDPKAVLLAAQLRADPRIPLWLRQISPGQLAAAVTRYAVAGWQPDDMYGACEEWIAGGRVLFTRPDNPVGYLCSILRQIPVDQPPALLDRARTAMIEENDRIARQRERDQRRAEVMAAAQAAAGPDSPGRRAARQIVDAAAARSAGRAHARAREKDQAQRELAQRARERG
ncbi:hypothetical protein [Nocardia sp. alder85J]|uniref:hypothetical protein n=1 Tax=Nocardia sp. alder85J TaxID=2862949 RepID=UPI001CD600B6|nr:hypothetical protein [Nocardia sp. alder85J]MCX4099270.1 hypothetical protein [Nocardia sp. alder85J]